MLMSRMDVDPLYHVSVNEQPKDELATILWELGTGGIVNAMQAKMALEAAITLLEKDYQKGIYIAEAVQLTRKLYEFHGACGPIHIISDDGNLENSHLSWCWEYNRDEEPEGEAKELVKEILRILSKLDCAGRTEYYNTFWKQPELYEPFDIEEAAHD